MASTFTPNTELRTPKSQFLLLLGIFFTSAATLTLQISIIRLLSVAQWHHFAFMVVSMALLGYGASGSFLTSFPSLLPRGNPGRLMRTMALFSLSALLAYLMSNQIPFDLARISWDRWQIFHMFLYYLAFSIPFFFSGMTLSMALSEWSAHSGKLYSSDLCGAALGCLLVLGLFSVFGGPGTLLFACLLGGLAALIFGWISKPVKLFPWMWLASVALLLLWQPSWTSLRISPYKALAVALRFPGARLLETHWNAVSRIDILESPAARTAPGLSLDYLEPLPPQLGLTVDGDQLNAITRLQGEPSQAADLKFMDYLPSSFSYQLTKPGRVLILEPKGGLEVLSALRHRPGEVVVVEPNPIIVELLQETFQEYSGGLYLRQGVRVVVEEGRSFIRRVPESFDLVVLPLAESLGASSTGFAGLHEDYRLTTEAFREYLRVLQPGGFLSFSLYLLPPPRGELRLVSTAQEALDKMGKRPEDHLLAFRSWGTFSLLVKKSPIAPREVEALKAFCHRLHFDLVYYPGMTAEEANIHNRFPQPIYFAGVQGLLQKGKKFYSHYPFDVSPAADDRPFFHFFFRWRNVGEIYRLAGGKWQILLEGGFLVPVVFFLALFFSLLFIAFPLIFTRKPTIPRTYPYLIYFAGLGFGFMFVEISLIQKFILFLGHPIYSVSLVVFSLLVSAGIGSRLTTGLALRELRGLKFLLLGIVGILLLGAFFLPQILPLFHGKSFFFRQLLTFFFIAPLGLLMGTPFPLGIRWVGSRWPLLVPWAWCANGCASVLGSILPVIIALAWGFQTVFFLAALFYLLSLLAVWKSC